MPSKSIAKSLPARDLSQYRMQVEGQVRARDVIVETPTTSRMPANDIDFDRGEDLEPVDRQWVATQYAKDGLNSGDAGMTWRDYQSVFNQIQQDKRTMRERQESKSDRRRAEMVRTTMDHQRNAIQSNIVRQPRQGAHMMTREAERRASQAREDQRTHDAARKRGRHQGNNAEMAQHLADSDLQEANDGVRGPRHTRDPRAVRQQQRRGRQQEPHQKPQHTIHTVDPATLRAAHQAPRPKRAPSSVPAQYIDPVAAAQSHHPHLKPALRAKRPRAKVAHVQFTPSTLDAEEQKLAHGTAIAPKMRSIWTGKYDPRAVVPRTHRADPIDEHVETVRAPTRVRHGTRYVPRTSSEDVIDPSAKLVRNEVSREARPSGRTTRAVRPRSGPHETLWDDLNGEPPSNKPTRMHRRAPRAHHSSPIRRPAAYEEEPVRTIVPRATRPRRAPRAHHNSPIRHLATNDEEPAKTLAAKPTHRARRPTVAWEPLEDVVEPRLPPPKAPSRRATRRSARIVPVAVPVELPQTSQPPIQPVIRQPRPASRLPTMPQEGNTLMLTTPQDSVQLGLKNPYIRLKTPAGTPHIMDDDADMSTRDMPAPRATHTLPGQYNRSLASRSEMGNAMRQDLETLRLEGVMDDRPIKAHGTKQRPSIQMAVPKEAQVVVNPLVSRNALEAQAQDAHRAQTAAPRVSVRRGVRQSTRRASVRMSQHDWEAVEEEYE